MGLETKITELKFCFFLVIYVLPRSFFLFLFVCLFCFVFFLYALFTVVHFQHLLIHFLLKKRFMLPFCYVSLTLNISVNSQNMLK